ncbi:exosome complex exonuclease Rrp41 [Candidatus Woesearchaeota archaeon]|jgi:exosome complex component RRP41|nr:exosome complex exonuclease Rrp41 [Candidatus Woesearchaeota archaeon]MBT3439024.1 exosome complex exonuclease Rrp41 [Candidatus Woesearchaeota archaeon]MBT4058632.1 exosome complex exonuclease Rrp41 [Candidatus Woesearchaeota archaeon]MBT4209215.1 exosome complex exonuclease Rrp41 [Candidatus Woesearchaeota archaeon]MBT4730396.1 exosome complex exonuclease Rrp41 [Candidatus Woesearchaeota archaeon]
MSKNTKAVKRHDGRKADGLREMEAKLGVIPSAKGSAMFRIGKTIAIASVRGPKKLHPKFLQDPERGKIRCIYNMMAFSGSGNRVRPGPNRRAKEINLVIENALTPAVKLDNYPGCSIDVFINLIQTDAGTRCAAITAASMALADAGFEMKDLVSAVAVGKVNGEVVADLDKPEEDVEDAVDIPIAMMPNEKEITLLQLDGLISQEDLGKAVDLAKVVCDKIYKLQKETIAARYE